MEIRVENPIIVVVPPNNQMAMLREQGGSRVLTITLSGISMALLTWEIKDIESRPEIFKFVSECVGCLKGSIEKIVIYDMASDGMYLSHVAIKDTSEDRLYKMDLHVTDALVLALASKCPIFVVEEVFVKTQKYKNAEQDSLSEEEARRIFNNMDPSKLIKH